MIIGIFGGIGSGKTMTGVYLTLTELNKGKKILTNTKLKKVPTSNINYLTAKNIETLFKDVKAKKLNLYNTTIFIQELHNYVDSRNSMSHKNRVFSYFILQSRHTGKGSCDIIYDTQHIGQVDKRVRGNTDLFLYPDVVEWELMRNGSKTIKIPHKIRVKIVGYIGQKFIRSEFSFLCQEIMRKYDTHELVDF